MKFLHKTICRAVVFCVIGFVLLDFVFSAHEMRVVLPKASNSIVCEVTVADPPAASDRVYLSKSEEVQQMLTSLENLHISFAGVIGNTYHADVARYRLIFGEENNHAGDVTIAGRDVFWGRLHFKMNDTDAEQCNRILERVLEKNEIR